MTDITERLLSANDRTVKADLLDLIKDARAAIDSLQREQEEATRTHVMEGRMVRAHIADVLEDHDPEDNGGDLSTREMDMFDALGRSGGVPTVHVTLDAWFFRRTMPTEDQVLDKFCEWWNDLPPCGVFNGVPALKIQVREGVPSDVAADGDVWDEDRPGVPRP